MMVEDKLTPTERRRLEALSQALAYTLGTQRPGSAAAAPSVERVVDVAGQFDRFLEQGRQGQQP